MDRLTREEVAGAVARGYCTTANMYKELDADLITGITNEVMALLQSLSQEAVRDEVLEEIIEWHDKQRKLAELNSDGHEGPQTKVALKRHSRFVKTLTTLKREPNAALGMEHPNAASAGPAPVAPVAEVAKRLRSWAYAHPGNVPEDGSLLMEEAAALLAKLGQQVETLQAAHDLGWAHKTCPNCGANMMTGASDD